MNDSIEIFKRQISHINEIFHSYENLTNDELREKGIQIKISVSNSSDKNETLNKALPEVYALVKETARRFSLGQVVVMANEYDIWLASNYDFVEIKGNKAIYHNKWDAGGVPFEWNMVHYDEQLLGGILLHYGYAIEMATGEGKTLVATLPVFLNALTHQGVHLMTVNDYLSKRDYHLTHPIYAFHGLTVECIEQYRRYDERRKYAYKCDITFGTNSGFVFDYLFDHLATDPKECVQERHNFAIIDELDSILIDEARTPLIISGQSDKSTKLYELADGFVKSLKKGRLLNEDEALNPLIREELKEEGDFVVDEKLKTCTLTQQGVEKAERFFAIDNLSDPQNMEIQHHINNALKANNTMALDKDYVVKDGEIVIVDTFTGRMMPGRRYSDGLHQAIEAKEHVEVQRESKTLATITFQNFFNKYTKKSGMTGTAQTEEQEFRSIYGMDVVCIPTNRPVQRKDLPDIVYQTEDAKFRAVVEDVKKAYEVGQPVLVGTVNIEVSERLSKMFKMEGIKHQVLNAKYHEKEAEIVALAGEKGAVTIATNMAGRGTDIKLGEGVVELGGLKIVGTERHESRRIDNQLRGRSGRQGDVGESKFYISLEDDIMRLFASEKLMSIFNALGVPENEEIHHKSLTKTIERAQKKIEGNNFGIRKNLMEYDKVNNDQREIIYAERARVLNGENMRDAIIKMMNEVIESQVDMFVGDDQETKDWDVAGLSQSLFEIIPVKLEIPKS